MKAIVDTQPKSAVGMASAELRERIRPTAQKAIQDAWDKNTYISYYDEALCPNIQCLVHEYKNRKELVHIDEDGITTLVKTL